MAIINKGDTLFIPAEVGAGAFSGECLITFDTIDGPVSGFISSEQIITKGATHLIRAQVLQVDSDRFTVRLPGSFFTTTGLAHISAESKFERAA